MDQLKVLTPPWLSDAVLLVVGVDTTVSYMDELEQAMAPGGLMEGMRELKQQGIVKHLGT